MNQEIGSPAGKGGWRTFFALATDPWMVSAPGLAATAVAYAILASVTARVGGFSIGASLLSALVAFALQTVVLWLSYRLALSRRWWRRHVLVSTAYVTAAVLIVGGLTSSLLAGAVGNDNAAPESLAMWLERIAALLLITAGWNAMSAFRSSMAREAEAQERLLLARSAAVETVERQRREVVDRIREMMDEVLREPQLVEQGRVEEVRERIRTLSHELHDVAPGYEVQAPSTLVAPDWKLIADAVLGRPIIRPLLMAVVVTAFFIAQTGSTDVGSTTAGQSTGDGLQVNVDVAGLVTSLAYLAAVFLTTWILSVVAVRITGPRLASMPLGLRALWVLVTPILLALGVQIVIELGYVLPGLSTDLPDSLLDRLLATIPIFVIAVLILAIRAIGGLFALAEARRRELTDELAWEVARANETLVQERQSLSMAVHGPVQSTVAAVALALQERRSAGEVAAEDGRAREKLQELIDRLERGPNQRRSLLREADLLTSTWSGVCDVRMEIADDARAVIETDWVGEGTVADVLIEAVANAAVHGGASAVWVTVSLLNPRTVLVDVVDNGAVAEAGAPGLGSRMLDDVSVAWEREATDAGVRLQVWLPVAGQAADAAVSRVVELARKSSTVLDGDD